jgi:uncharacterized protein
MRSGEDSDMSGSKERANVLQATALLEELVDYIKPLDSAAVAFSGGVDSTLVLLLTVRALGADKVIAVTADSETLPARDREEAVDLAGQVGVTHSLVRTAELENEDFSSNTEERCFHCKTELWQHVRRLADEAGLKHMLDGVNADDMIDHRPGIKASDDAGVLHPLAARGVSKEGVRVLARELGLPNADKPSQACLASRLPYGQKITAEGLQRIEKAEEILYGLGFEELRVRDHGGVARIEVPADLLEQLTADDARPKIVDGLKELGFTYVTLDLEGFRSGSLNEAL